MIRINEISTLPPEGAKRRDYEKKTGKMAQRIGKLGRLFEGDGSHALLVVLQGMDASGKDGVKRNVFEQVSPGVVCSYAFKKPTSLELSHDFLWRIHRVVPSMGQMMIFNRSHYEDVLIQRVHNWIDEERVEKRIKAINNFEEMLGWDNNTTVLKFYLHISREKQLEKLHDRMENPLRR
jgi:polyphosphate kinase 2 (PPK2 family)